MTSQKRTIIKEGIQDLKYELMFIKHKLDLIENLVSGLEEKVYSDEPITEPEDKILTARVKMLMQEYQKLKNLVNPEKVKFELDPKVAEEHI